LDALGIRHGLLAVTRCDLADPRPAMAQAAAEIAATSLGTVESFPVSAVPAEALPRLLAGLTSLAGAMPAADPGAAGRLCVDRAFSITGSGTVVTGTLPAGTIRAADELQLAPSLRPVRVRGIQSLAAPVAQASGVARVALNLRGASASGAAGERAALSRGMALVQAGRWTLTSVVDARLSRPPRPPARAAAPRLPRELTLHIGSARTVARVRVLGGVIARLTLREPPPLHVGDRVLLRDPGARADGHPSVLGATILDVAPPPLAGRGAAAACG